MSEYDNTDRGVLFRNEQKKSDKHPDYSGSINLADGEHFLDGWLNRSKGGKAYLSLKIGKLKGQPREGGQQARQQDDWGAGGDPWQDEVPFRPRGSWE